MKKGFIRLCFGDFTIEGNKYNRELKEGILKSKVDYLVYVFGENNFEYLKRLGIESKCKLVDKKNVLWDINTQTFRHKLEAYRLAMEDDCYDEIVFLDWDLMETNVVPNNIFDLMHNKKEIQTCGYRNKSVVSFWRGGEDSHLGVCAPFIYIRDKTYPRKFIDIWEYFGTIQHKYPRLQSLQQNDEWAIAYFIDEINGGWKGIDFWWENYETMFANLPRKSIINNERLAQKKECFRHLL